MYKYTAIGNKVLVEVFDKRNETKSGLSLPVTKNNLFVPCKGIVASVGSRVDESIKVGLKVLFEKYVGDVVESNNRKFILLNSSNLLAILPDDADVYTWEEDKDIYK